MHNFSAISRAGQEHGAPGGAEQRPGEQNHQHAAEAVRDQVREQGAGQDTGGSGRVSN